MSSTTSRWARLPPIGVSRPSSGRIRRTASSKRCSTTASSPSHSGATTLRSTGSVDPAAWRAQPAQPERVARRGQRDRRVHRGERRLGPLDQLVARVVQHVGDRQLAAPRVGELAPPEQRRRVDQAAYAGDDRRRELLGVAAPDRLDVAGRQLVQRRVPGEVRPMGGLPAARGDPRVQPAQAGDVGAGLVEHVGPGVHRVAGRGLEGQHLLGQRAGLVVARLVLPDEGEQRPVPPVTGVRRSDALDQVPGLLLHVGDAGERDGRHRRADREHVPRVRVHVPHQGRGAAAAAVPDPRVDDGDEAALPVGAVVTDRARAASSDRRTSTESAPPSWPSMARAPCASAKPGSSAAASVNASAAPDCTRMTASSPRLNAAAASGVVVSGRPITSRARRGARGTAGANSSAATEAATAAAWARISGTAVVSNSSPRRIAPRVQTGASCAPDASTSRPPWVRSPRPNGPGTAVPLASRSSIRGSATRRTSPCGPVQLTTASTVRRRPEARTTTRPSRGLLGGEHLVGADPEGAVGAHPGHGGRGAGRHPVPVEVPPGRVGAEEVGALVRAEAGPQGCRQRAQGVEGGAPVAGLADGGGHGVADQGAQLVEVGGRCAGRDGGELGRSVRASAAWPSSCARPGPDRGGTRRAGCGRGGRG